MLDLILFCNKAYHNHNFMVTLYLNSEKKIRLQRFKHSIS